MEGAPDSPETRGIIPNSFMHIFNNVRAALPCLVRHNLCTAFFPLDQLHKFPNPIFGSSFLFGNLQRRNQVWDSGHGFAELPSFNPLTSGCNTPRSSLSRIRDLLAKDPTNRLELKESVDSGVYVKDLTNFVVKSVGEIDQVMKVSPIAS